MSVLALVLVVAPFATFAYAYLVYPALLKLVTLARRPRPPVASGISWPMVTVTVPVYNAEGTIAATIDRLLELDYPKDRLQILVMSDASSDGTDAIVRGYAARGVEMFRQAERRGKTMMENLAVGYARGEIIVNVDSTVLVPRDSLKPLVRAFDDPTIGVASGRDVSVGDVAVEGTGGESGDVDYEMRVRDLETSVGSIVGASGCFFGVRRAVHATPLPPELSWDFASALVARELGFRSVSVAEAVCIVPRTKAIGTEMTRKVRTMARGLSTLFYKRALMNPFRYGPFALMLISHKLLRWLPYLLAPLSLVALGVLSLQSPAARVVFAVATLGALAGVVGIRWPKHRRAPGILVLAGFVIAAFTAGFLAWVDAIRGKRMATWNPTPRPEAQLT
jgi:hypothetical protein